MTTHRHEIRLSTPPNSIPPIGMDLSVFNECLSNSMDGYERCLGEAVFVCDEFDARLLEIKEKDFILKLKYWCCGGDLKEIGLDDDEIGRIVGGG